MDCVLGRCEGLRTDDVREGCAEDAHRIERRANVGATVDSDAASMSAAIELADVTFDYEGSAASALNGVSLTIRPGDFLGVIGASGAGKSTLVAAMNGAIPHHHRGRMSGRVFVDGRETSVMTPTDIARIVGSVGQDIDAQMVASSVEDEILFGMENFGVPHDRIARCMSDVLERVGIEELRDREIATLSGGQKQKVAVAALMALSPRVLVLDEPTAALDPASSRMVFELLRRLNRDEGVTVVVVEQKVALLAEFCDRVAVMEAGRIAMEGPVREVFGRGRELQRIGVDCPRVTRVSNSLRECGAASREAVSLTVEEAVSLVAECVGGPKVCDGFGDHGDEEENFELADGAKKELLGANAFSDATAFASEGEGGETGRPVLEFDDVGFFYPGGTSGVHGVTFAVMPGEFVAVVGANGAGKTTITKLATGLLKPQTGTVRLAGCDVARTRTSVLARHAATLFQNPDRQICQRTVLDEVAFNLLVRGVPRKDAIGRARQTIERFGLLESAEPFVLSRGQRQMVALASAVAANPEVLILDEPTSGLDYRECMTVMRLVEEMRRNGCAVLMVCHDMEVVADFATRMVVMGDGCVLADGAPREVFSNEAVMRRARIAPPQVAKLSSALVAQGLGAFAGISEVADLVDVVLRLRTCEGAVPSPASRERPGGEPVACDSDFGSGAAAHMPAAVRIVRKEVCYG